MKRIIIAILLIIFSVFIQAPVKAKTSIDNDLVEYIEESIVKMGFYEETSSYYFGNPLAVYCLKGDNYERLSNAETYQVYKDDCLILLVTVTNESTKIYQPSKELADITADGSLKIIVKETSAYAVTNDKSVLVEVVPGGDVIKLKDSEIENAKSIKADYKTNELYQLCPGNNGKSMTVISFPNIAQNPYPHGCWCACIAAFCNYYKSFSYTAATVANQYYPSTAPSNVPGATMSEIESRLSNGYHIVTNSVTSPNVSTMVSNLSSNKKYIIGWISYTYGLHVTCMFDYETKSNGTYKLWFMDPWGNSSMSSGAVQYGINQTGTSFPTNTYIFGSTQGTYYFSSGLVYSYYY